MDTPTRSIASAARKLLPDCTYDCQFEALLPIFRIRLVGSVQVGANMSSVARFVLRCISLQVNSLSSISNILGLDLSDAGYGAAELRDLGLIETHASDSSNDTNFTLSPEGKRVIEENATLFKLRKQSLQVDFNPLSGELQIVDEDTVSVDEARKRGDFVEPIRKKRPSPKDLKLSEVRELVKATGQLQQGSDLVGIIKMDEPFSLYRPVTVVVLLHKESNEQRVLVFRGRRHLEKESQELQRLLDGGKQVIQPGLAHRQDTLPELPGASIKEKQSIDKILLLERESDDLESALVGSEESAESTITESENANLIADLRRELDKKDKEIEDLNRVVAAESNGKARLVSAKEHRPLLLHALREASYHILIVVPWLVGLDDDLCAEVSQSLKRGVKITIVWGLGTKWGMHREQAKAKSKPSIDKLRAFAKKIPESKLEFIEAETHERFLFCDSKFAVIGSYNWLATYASSNSKDSSYYTERPNDIEELRKGYAYLTA